MTRLQFIKMEMVKIALDETMSVEERAAFIDEIWQINGVTQEEKAKILQDAREFGRGLVTA